MNFLYSDTFRLSDKTQGGGDALSKNYKPLCFTALTLLPSDVLTN